MGRDDERDRDRSRRDRSRERSRRDRSRSRDRSRRDRSRREKSADKAAAEPAPAPAPKESIEMIRQKSEIDDLTKDQRTVFVSQLVMKATEKQIRKFFEKVGKVKDVIMIRDKYTNRHKGFAYVEMADLESVPMVLMLNGTVADFQRFPILVKASEAEKNFLAKQEATAAQQEAAEVSRAAAAPRKQLLVGNLHPNITESDLRTVLAPFGAVDAVDMGAVAPGSAVVTFVHADDAAKASSRIAGIELGADKPITVEFYDDPALAGGGVSSSDWRLDSDAAAAAPARGAAAAPGARDGGVRHLEHVRPRDGDGPDVAVRHPRRRHGGVRQVRPHGPRPRRRRLAPGPRPRPLPRRGRRGRGRGRAPRPLVRRPRDHLRLRRAGDAPRPVRRRDVRAGGRAAD